MENKMTKDADLFYYCGKIYVRPCGRGVVLEDHPDQEHLDDVLGEGYYQAEIKIAAIEKGDG